MNQQLLKEFKESPFVQVVKDYVQEQIDKLNNVSSYTTLDAVLGGQNAIRILKDLIRQLENKEVKDKVPNQYK